MQYKGTIQAVNKHSRRANDVSNCLCKNVLRLYLASAVPGHVGTSPSKCVSVQDEEVGRGFHSTSGLSACC